MNWQVLPVMLPILSRASQVRSSFPLEYNDELAFTVLQFDYGTHMQDSHKKASHYAHVDQEGRIYSRQVCFIRQGGKVPGHPCLGPNRVADVDGFFNIRDIANYTSESGLESEEVDFDTIWSQSHGDGEKDWILQNDPRYAQADVSFPGILSPIQNPDNQPYRMLDGRRRMWKQQAAGKTAGSFYIIPEERIYNFFWMITSQEQFVQQINSLSQRK